MIRTILTVPALLATAGMACPPDQMPAEPQSLVAAEPAAAAPPRVEVVFVLDTTGSMGGLIEGAKQKIWSIANTIATAKPHPQVRMGLVAYRDRGDEYVTKLTPLTDDLDAVYADLMAFTANGGGDTPESVNQGLHEAVTRFDWSTDPGALRMIYLVGDCPPHMDYQDDTPYATTCELAARRGLTINTIQCGSHTDTTPIWQEIARSAEGEYFQVDQSGGAVAVATPMDEDLARLTRELEATVIAYGDRTAVAAQLARSERALDLAGAAPAEALAERAEFKASDAGVVSLCGTQELVQDCQDKKVDLAAIPADQLPEEMRGMSADERAKFVERKAQTRAEVRKQIHDLSAKRAAFLAEHLAAAGGRDSFDAAIVRALRKQAGRAGLTFGAGAGAADTTVR